MLAATFQALHFQQFLQEHGPLPDTLVSCITTLQEEPSVAVIESLESNEAYLDFMHTQST